MLEIFHNGGPVMYPLLACSVLTLTVIIERSLFWLKLNRQHDQALTDEILELCRLNDWDGVRRKAQGSHSYVLRILISGIVHREYSLLKAMEAAAAEEVRSMRRYMGVLDTMITVAPLLGIFGTVLGIIASFDMLSATGIEHPAAVTQGIAQALITTASGLAIAILSVFPNNYFNSKIEQAVLTIEKYATSLEVVTRKLANDACATKEEDIESKYAN